MPRPLKVHLIFPFVYLTLTVVITTLPMIAKPVETVIGIAMILSALPVYWIFIAWQTKPVLLAKLTLKVTELVQKLFTVLPPPKEE